MRILVTGSKGQLGQQVIDAFSQHSSTLKLTGVDLDEMDITDQARVNAVMHEVQPDLVIHCAALTAVDYCADHPIEAAEINGFGTQNIALACQHLDAALLYVSTNEVFSGRKGTPYWEYDQPQPLNPYGYSKWMGEQIVRDLVRKHYIVRLSWLFAVGGRNFIHTILRLAREGRPLRVVTNEIGCPTYAADLAEALVQLVRTECYGIYHLTNEGLVSRYHFARAILDAAGMTDYPIQPIALAEYPRASRPPEYGVLANMAAARLGIRLRPWRDALQTFIAAEGLAAPEL